MFQTAYQYMCKQIVFLKSYGFLKGEIVKIEFELNWIWFHIFRGDLL